MEELEKPQIKSKKKRNKGQHSSSKADKEQNKEESECSTDNLISATDNDPTEPLTEEIVTIQEIKFQSCKVAESTENMTTSASTLETEPELESCALSSIDCDGKDNDILIPLKLPENHQKLVIETKAEIKELPEQKIKKSEGKIHSAKTSDMSTVTESQMCPFTDSQLASLYANEELKMLDSFVTDFIDAEIKGNAHKQIPLFNLLINYLQYRNKLKCTEREIQQRMNECKNIEGKLWVLKQMVQSKSAICNDNIKVNASYQYMQATFDHGNFNTLMRMRKEIKNTEYENYVFNSYMVHVLRLKIDYFVQNVINGIIGMTHLHPRSPIALMTTGLANNVQPFLSDLRLCISILFKFQRKLIRDKEFIDETRNWLEQLVAVLLRSASWQDHLFIINHVLRCPPGIGTWAVKFIQAPLDAYIKSPFSSYEVNHVISLLAVILLPTQKRDLFLNELSCQPDVVEALWVVVDSEGEEDDENSGTLLKENDIVSLLNQLPLDKLFRAVLHYEKRNVKGILNESHVLRLFSFLSVILQILQRGLNTYNHSRYMQLCKRLCRLIRHCIQYATDQFLLFRTSQEADHSTIQGRLQVEYDALFSRAFYYLYIFGKLGSWQFLAVLPYELVTPRTLWKLYYFLHDFDATSNNLLDCDINPSEYAAKIWDAALRNSFDEHLVDLADDECYYFLNTLTNMAYNRTVKEMDFIIDATLNLVHIGYISELTSEKCSKNVRILLSHITSKYTRLLSVIFKQVYENISKMTDLALYLYEELPISVWMVTDADMDRIESLLTMEYRSTESKLARMIISRLNWHFGSDYELFLPYKTHCRTATLVAKCTEIDSNYLNWAWQTALRLRLHISDKGIKSFAEVKDIEHFDAIYRGVRAKQPLCSFLSILMSSWGHLIPQIATDGLDQLLFLQLHGKHEATLFALNLIIPLFLNCQESLINLEKYQLILLGLVNADRTYMSVAKSLVTTQSSILNQFGRLIEMQIVRFHDFGIENPRWVVRLWMNSLVSISNWNKDEAVLYLLNVIVKGSLFYPDCMEVVSTVLRDMLQCDTPQEQMNSLGSLLKWGSVQNVLLVNSPLLEYPYLAVILIDLEFEERERATGLWNEILKQIYAQKGKARIDAAIKAAANKLKQAVFTSSSLCIYRWAQQALDTPIDHPVLVLFWQKFFALYFYQVAINPNEMVCVGDKFFEGLINSNFLKKMQKRLQDTIAFYKLKTTESDFENLSPLRQMFYTSSHRIFNCFSLWLQESRLLNPYLYIAGIHQQYEPHLLNTLQQGSQTLWMEYIDQQTITDECRQSETSWMIANYREHRNTTKPIKLSSSTESNTLDPWECIKLRLDTYDQPVEAPSLNIDNVLIPKVNVDDKDALWREIIEQLNHFCRFSKNYLLDKNQHATYLAKYEQIIVKLYSSHRSIVKQTCSCDKTNRAVLCSGPKVISMQICESKLNEAVADALQNVQTQYEDFLDAILKWTPRDLVKGSALLQHIISLLENRKLINPDIVHLGAEIFYHILSLVDEETLKFLPANQLFSECLERLGQTFICGDNYETPNLLQYIIKNPKKADYLVPHFSPVNIGTANFLLAYETVVKGFGSNFELLLSLLTKFDISKWLLCNKPKLSQRSQFIDAVINALTNLGPDSQESKLPVQEVYRKHLMSIFLHQFPEHYGEVLVHVLNASTSQESDSIAVNVWLDMLTALAAPETITLNCQYRKQLRSYAHNQKLLNYPELLATMDLLAKHFTKERLQFGLYGLYPRTRDYVEVISVFIGMIGHGFIISALNTHQGILGDKMCEIIWPRLIEIFAPWIIPYCKNNLMDSVATWIQQLTDDRNILLPWNQANSPFGQKMANMFFECVLFVIQTLPASNIILNFLWHWYVTNFAHLSVKEHVVNVIHHSFIELPWQNFWPTIPDLELMLRVGEMHLPECHVFLGRIFMTIDWKTWLNNLPTQINAQAKSRVYHCFLSLTIKLCNDPKVRQNYLSKAENLLDDGEKFEWHILEPQSAQQAADWYIMSVDPSVVLNDDKQNLDLRLISFLRTVCNYNIQYCGVDEKILAKRLVFVKTYVKLVTLYINKHKSVLASKEKNLIKLVLTELSFMESVVNSQEEMNILLGNILQLLNEKNLSKAFSDSIEAWVRAKQGNGLITRAILESVGLYVTSNNNSLSDLYEAAITAYFEKNALEIENLSWSKISSHLQPNASNYSELVEVLIKNGNILTLYALILKKIGSCSDSKMLLNLCFNWLSKIKLSTDNETKIPLIWSAFIDLASELAKVDETAACEYFYKLAQYLILQSESKDSEKWSGLLGAIGISKATTEDLKFTSRALAGYILSQMPESKVAPKKLRLEANAPGAVGQTGGNSEVPKVLLKLDFGQSQGIIKKRAELALLQIQDPQNSLHNIKEFLENLLLQFYTKPYIKLT